MVRAHLCPAGGVGLQDPWKMISEERCTPLGPQNRHLYQFSEENRNKCRFWGPHGEQRPSEAVIQGSRRPTPQPNTSARWAYGKNRPQTRQRSPARRSQGKMQSLAQRRPSLKARLIRSKPLARPRGAEKLRSKPLFRPRGWSICPEPKIFVKHSRWPPLYYGRRCTQLRVHPHERIARDSPTKPEPRESSFATGMPNRHFRSANNRSHQKRKSAKPVYPTADGV